MFKRKLVSIVFLLVLFVLNITIAQTITPKIVVSSKAYTSGIKLRWIPNKQLMLTKPNFNNSYTIRKTVIRRNGAAVNEVSTFVVGPTANPTTGSFWEPYKISTGMLPGTEPTYYNTVYNLIYGDATAMNEKNYFNYAITSNLSFQVCEKAGIAFTDNAALANEAYKYEVKFENESNYFLIVADIAKLAAGTPDNTALPNTPTITFTGKIPQMGGQLEKRIAKITWNALNQKTIYSSYYIERSVNGAAYKQLRALPFFNFSGGDNIVYSDTIPVTRGQFTYRIKGRTFFDDYFNSAIVSARNPTDAEPKITSNKPATNGTDYHLQWDYPAANIDSTITGFIIEKSTLPDNGFTKITTIGTAGLLAKELREINVPGLLTNTYVRVGAVDKFDPTIIVYSSPVAVIFPDLSPPAIPSNVTVSQVGQTTTLNINWAANTEPDLQGYKIFRKLNNDSEIIEITCQANIDANGNATKCILNTSTTFSDPVLEDKNVIVENITYFIVAVDINGNQSQLSAGATFQLPDNNPPIAPNFKGYTLTVKPSVIINWENSPIDKDIAFNTLYRRLEPSTVWLKVADFPKTQLFYEDNNVTVGSTYTYVIQAFDTKLPTPNSSSLSSPLNVEMQKREAKPIFTNFRVVPNREGNYNYLTWNYAHAQLSKFEIIRGFDGAEPSSWKVMNYSELETDDQNITFLKNYNYKIRAIFYDSSVSNWAEFSLNFPSECIIGVFKLEKNATIPPLTQTILEEACDEIRLKPGFNARGVGILEYKAKIKN